MSIALRLNDDLVHEAEIEAVIHKRTAPKQIEYWAQIGKVVARNASSNELLALLQGFAQVQVKPGPSARVEADEIFAAVDQSRTNGSLSKQVSQAPLRYEMSRSIPGLLDQVSADGSRRPGHFSKGVFTPEG